MEQDFYREIAELYIARFHHRLRHRSIGGDSSLDIKEDVRNILSLRIYYQMFGKRPSY